MTQHSPAQIAAAAANLHNLLKAGLSTDKSIEILNRIQRNAGWDAFSKQIRQGTPLSTCLNGVWPENLVSAVEAGEQSGKLSTVMKQVEEMMLLIVEIKKKSNEIIVPFFISTTASIAILILFMVFVIPTLSRITGGMGGNAEKSSIQAASEFISSLLSDYWVYMLAAILATVYGMVVLVRSQEFKNLCFEVLDKTPVIGEAIRNLSFGLWTKSLAILAAAGNTDITRMLLLSSKVLPDLYRPGVIKMSDEVVERGLEDSSDPDKQPPYDDRRKWPYLVFAALAAANQTGRIDEEMLRVSPALINDGMVSINRAIAFVGVMAKVVPGIVLALPASLYYMEFGRVFQQVMKV